jgi:CRISPR-associated protein Csb2
MRHAQGDALRILSGHQADGRPAETPHAAYVALPFVDHLHADGHVMGMALVLPRLEPAQFQACLAAIASALDPDTLTIRLVLGRGGEMMLAPEEREMPDQALRTDTWTRASRVWASATPIVLDRFPRNPADAEPVVALACTRIGLPSPANVQVSGTSWLAGSPHAREFESMTRKQDGAGRWHVHARLTFATPVAGPVILGAGRFRGYGLCRPVSEDIQ